MSEPTQDKVLVITPELFEEVTDAILGFGIKFCMTPEGSVLLFRTVSEKLAESINMKVHSDSNQDETSDQ